MSNILKKKISVFFFSFFWGQCTVTVQFFICDLQLPWFFLISTQSNNYAPLKTFTRFILRVRLKSLDGSREGLT